MNEIITLTRKDLQLLMLDKASLVLSFALPLGLIALIGAVFSSSINTMGITSYDYAFSKVMFWGLIGGAASSVALIAIEKNSGTIIRMQLSPINKFQLLAGKSFASLTLLMTSALISWLFATTVFGIRTNSFPSLVMVFISNAIFFTGFMTFLGNFANTERAAGILSWSVLQILACFSGIMFPVYIMPPWMQTATNINPVTWGVKALEIALWKDYTFTEILLPVGIPIASGLFFFGLSVFIFKWRAAQ